MTEMKHQKKFLLVFLILTIFGVNSQPTCSTTSNRIDCGYVGITESECVNSGCCWNEVNPNPSNLPWCFYQNSGSPQCFTDRPRADCGYAGVTQSECEAQNCCWDEINPNPNNLPWCYFSNDVIQGYKVYITTATSTGVIMNLQVIDPNTLYGDSITSVEVLIEMDTNERLHVKIYDPNNDRWEIPTSVIPRSPPTSAPSSPKYQYSYTENPFGIAVTRLSDNVVIFNSTVAGSNSPFNGLQFKDQFLSISTSLPSQSAIYGFEESTRPTGLQLVPNSIYTLWNRDTPCSSTNVNLYGSHPFYLNINPNGNANGVLLLSSSGMDIFYGSDYITYNVIGGVLDFYFFIGPSADDVVAQYTNLIGLPHLQPYWAFGFHQCKYGYPNIQYVEQVVANYSAANIPLDTIWSDIDYMDEYQDFTWDPVNYPVNTVQSFADQLHEQNQQYVIILDPGIKKDTSYTPYNDLINSGGYIKDEEGNAFVGQVWPGYTIFPDFLNPAGQSFWEQQISTVLGTVPYDGLWIDMNEISNFCSGECLNGSPVPLGSTTCGCSSSSSFIKILEDDYYYSGSFNAVNPPYSINNDGDRDPLNTKTLDMTSYHYNNVLEYNAHNLFGLTEAIATKTALENYYNDRAFVLSRSTFPSSGHWTAHWTGDNYSDFDNLYYSILGMLSFNILGIPMIGSDICGFNGNTTEELCSRWIEVGAFYPFSRDHDTTGAESQELYRWPQVAQISQFILRVRYSVLPLYYTLNYLASTNGGQIIRPLFFQFPTDTTTWKIDSQFLVGNSLMVVPVITEGATSVTGYFPAGNWFDFYNDTQISLTKGSDISLYAPVTFVPIYVLGGSIFARSSSPQLTTHDTRLSPFNLTVAFDQNFGASGSLYVDDGKSINTSYSYVTFSASVTGGKGELTSTVVASGYANQTYSTSLTAVKVLGLTSAPSSVTANNVSVTSFVYNNGVLVVSNLTLDINSAFTLNWA